MNNRLITSSRSRIIGLRHLVVILGLSRGFLIKEGI